MLRVLVLPASLVVLVSMFENGGVAWAGMPSRSEVSPAAPVAAVPEPEVPAGNELDNDTVSVDEIGDPDGEASSALAGVLGDRFAGTWVDSETQRRQVAVVDPGPGDSERASSALRRDDVDLVEVTRSLAELESLRDAAVEIALEVGGEYTIGINHRENVVDGAVQADLWDDERLRPLRNLIAGSRGALVLAPAKIDPLYSNTSVGGVRMWVQLPGGNVGCSTGFGIGNSAFGEFMTSAGHCSYGTTGVNVRNSTGDACCISTVAGPVTLSHQTIDVMAFLRSADPKVWNGTEYPWVTGGNDPYVGEPVCYRGATSVVEQCGTVTRINYQLIGGGFVGPVYNYRGFCMSGVEPEGGDSGSAIYRYREEEIDGVPTVEAKGLLARGDAYVGGTPTLVCGPTISQVLSVTNSQLLVK